MAPWTDPRYDTSTWGVNTQGPWGNYVQAFQRVAVAAQTAAERMRAWLEAVRGPRPPRVRLRWFQMASDPLPSAWAPQPLTVRRELQRAGPTGYARLGGRRPL